MARIKTPKKLIEVALPLDDINGASGYEKLPGIGPHPRGIHHWWARRPFAAARAIIFAQMVNDPGGERGYFSGKTKDQADLEREKLFEIMRGLSDWKRSDDEKLLDSAKKIISESWDETCRLNKGVDGFDSSELPGFHDPFAGGGAIPLEAQRLGLNAYASDLNPVAVMINKAMIEIPGRFKDGTPIGPIPSLYSSNTNISVFHSADEFEIVRQQRTQFALIFARISEEFLTSGFEFGKRFEVLVVQGFLLEEFPEAFDQIQIRRIGREEYELDA